MPCTHNNIECSAEYRREQDSKLRNTAGNRTKKWSKSEGAIGEKRDASFVFYNL